MRYQVPQFVDIEDKIIGPFTLKQFITYVVAVMLLVPVYLASDLSLFITVALPTLGLAALFAHFKLHGKSLFTVISQAITFFTRGQLFIWRRTSTLKPLKITGEEYDEFPAELSEAMSSLTQQAQSLATDGHITSEDLEDVFMAEPENKTANKKNDKE